MLFSVPHRGASLEARWERGLLGESLCWVPGVSVHSPLPASSQNGQTPLMLASEQGSLEIVQELIRREANVNLDDVVRRAQ